MANATAKRYPGEEHFVDGYVPQSLNAEYSSLHRSITWIGMGLVLASLVFWGTFVFGLSTVLLPENAQAAHTIGYVPFGETMQTMDGTFNGNLFLWGGLIGALILVIAGFACIHIGRRAYKAYKKEFGGHH